MSAGSTENDARATGHAWVDGNCARCGAGAPRPWAEDCAPATENDALPCCNVTEPDGILCTGSTRLGWPTFVCDTCGARCGAVVHQMHVISPGEPDA